MAGPCGLNVLLLWAGIIALAYCKSTAITTPTLPHRTTNSTPARIVAESSVTTSVISHKLPFITSNVNSSSSAQALSANNTLATQPPPASTSHSPTSTASSKNTSILTNLPTKQTSSPGTIENATNKDISKAVTHIECSYNVTPINTGVRIDVMSSARSNATAKIIDQGTTGSMETFSLKANQSTSHEIQHLRPCYDYMYKVEIIDIDKIQCNQTGNRALTLSMNENDIKTLPYKKNGYVCYQSDWNVTSSVSSSNGQSVTQNDNKTFCIELTDTDACSDVTINFTSPHCMNSYSFTITQNITLDYLNPSVIIQTHKNTIPVEIDIKLPPKCNIEDYNVTHTCWDPENKTKSLSELEPFKEYVCIGHIKLGNATITNTSEYLVKIKCDAQLTAREISANNNSISANYIVSSENCTTLNFSYECSCSAKGKKNGAVVKQQGGGCHITSLDPYTDYSCTVHPTYNNVRFGKEYNFKKQTEVGIPDAVPALTLILSHRNGIKVTCTSNGKFNGPKKYIVQLYVGDKHVPKETSEECPFEFKDLSYLTNYKVKVTTYNGKNKGQHAVKDIKTSYNDKALIAFLSLLIILVSMSLIFVMYKIYILRRRKSRDLSESMMLISTTHDEDNLMPVEPITAEVLLDAYKRKLADEGRLFLAEFQSIPRIFSRYTVKEAKKPCNVPKNRYIDILPYDYNRVQLTSGNGDAGCDYINASFIDGYKESKKYIAAQGPKDETVTDFWRMIWEQQSSIIVMVTRCEEGNRVKCAQYWPSPERETELFGEFIVKLSSEDQCPDYTIRRLSLTNKREKNPEREVTHIQFMSWPDHGVPEEAQLLLKLRRRVNAFKNFFSGPIVVHCSAGVGRTGTYISIDAMMEGLEAEGRVDIYGYIVRLRRQRCLMVQVEAQYILIHQALLEQNQFGETEIPVPELHSTLSTLKQRSSANEPSLMEDEFETLPNYKTWRTFNMGMTEENIKKNRSSFVIPYDYNRVVIKLEEGPSHDSDPDEDEEEDSSDEEDEGSTKYINASHLNGYWGPRAFIAAQTPLPDTMADFWSMVYQKRVSTIIMLSDCNSEDEDCGYWGKDKKTFEDLEVDLVSTDKSPTFIIRSMLIRHVKRTESRTVKHFQFLKWVSRELPETPQDLTDMIKDIKKSCDSKSQRNTPVLVHCNDGSSRTGIFCAMWNLLDSAYTENLVDVFQVVKTLRKERQGMLSSLEQYQFLYDTLEGVFPVQNGDVKTAKGSAANSIQIVNETKTAEQPSKETAEWPASANIISQQGAAERAGDAGSEETTEEPDEVSSESTPLEDTSNGPNVIVEV